MRFAVVAEPIQNGDDDTLALLGGSGATVSTRIRTSRSPNPLPFVPSVGSELAHQKPNAMPAFRTRRVPDSLVISFDTSVG